MKQIEKCFLCVIVVTIISGCVTSSGVFSTGKDTFTIIESVKDNFTIIESVQLESTTMDVLKKRAYAKANTYCEQRGKVMQTITTKTTEEPPAYSFELRFLALDSNDLEVSRTTHGPAVDTNDGPLADVTVIDTSKVTISWNANTESDLAGYKVYYDNTRGNYSNKVDIGNQTRYELTGLVSGQAYYIVTTSYDSAGNESPFSNEVVYTVPVVNVSN